MKDIIRIMIKGSSGYGCNEYDTFGSFKLVGGVAEDHPTEEEISGAVSFYEKNKQA